MKYVFPSFFLIPWIFLVFISCEQKPVENTQVVISEEDRKALTYLKEVEWPKTYATHDTLLLDRILGDEFQVIDASGNWSDKEMELSWIKENASDPDSFRYEIKRFEFLENGTAIICGTGHMVNDSVKTIYQSSNVLIKRGDHWKAVLSHVSGVKQIES